MIPLKPVTLEVKRYLENQKNSSSRSCVEFDMHGNGWTLKFSNNSTLRKMMLTVHPHVHVYNTLFWLL